MPLFEHPPAFYPASQFKRASEIVKRTLSTIDNSLVSAEQASFSALDTSEYETQVHPSEPDVNAKQLAVWDAGIDYSKPLASGISDLYAIGANTVYPSGVASRYPRGWEHI